MVENVEDPEAFAAAVEILGDTDEAFEHVDEMICIGEGYDVDRIIGEYYSDPSNVGELSQETIERYFDYEALGRDIRLEYYASEEGDPETAGEYWCGDENATDEEIGEAVVSELGFDGISNKEYYFDETSFGRDIHIEGSFCEIDGKIWEYTGR
jgi:antirestriction protein